MTNEIARIEPLNDRLDWCKAMSTGDLLPATYRNKPANLLFASEYADAIGVSRIHVLTSIAVINGRPSPSADLMSSLVRKHGHKLRVTSDDTHATAELIRADDPDFTFRAEWDEKKARKAGLWGNRGPWTNYPGAMLRARAISEVIRMGAPDALAGGIYMPEELGANVDQDGNVVDIPSERVQSSRTPQQAPSSNHDKAAAALGIVDKPAAVEAVPEGPRTLDDDTFDKSLLWIESATNIDELERQKAKAATLIPAQGKVITDIIDVRLETLRGDTLDAEVVDEPAA